MTISPVEWATYYGQGFLLMKHEDNEFGGAAAVGHNGGPPLEEPQVVPEWGRGGISTYFYWRAAHRAAWRNVSPEIMLRRLQRAELIGLTYREYTLEILERGRHLSLPDDAERIAEIKAARRPRPRVRRDGPVDRPQVGAYEAIRPRETSPSSGPGPLAQGKRHNWPEVSSQSEI